MSEAKKSKSKWEQWNASGQACGGGGKFVADGEDVGKIDHGGVVINRSALTPSEALAFAAWITAWFGTEEVGK